MNRKDIPFFIAVCARDVHYARPLVMSIRHQYPDNPIFLLPDGKMDLSEFNKIPGIYNAPKELDLPDLPHLTGLRNKIRLLYVREFDGLFFLDADTLLTGPVLDMISDPMAFYVNAYSDQSFVLKDGSEQQWELIGDIIYDPIFIREYDPAYFNRKAIHFISGHFYMPCKMVPTAWVDEVLPHLGLRHGDRPGFRYGDQGFLNYAFNKWSQENGPDMKYSEFTLFPNDKIDISDPPSLQKTLNRNEDRWKVLHYTKPSRKFLYEEHTYGDIMEYFASEYYDGRKDLRRTHLRKRKLERWKKRLGGRR
jgi:hypothetical protein